ncbi:hypothetical protein GCM10009562_30070 [Nocardioides aquaticus]
MPARDGAVKEVRRGGPNGWVDRRVVRTDCDRGPEGGERHRGRRRIHPRPPRAHGASGGRGNGCGATNLHDETEERPSMSSPRNRKVPSLAASAVGALALAPWPWPA